MSREPATPVTAPETDGQPPRTLPVADRKDSLRALAPAIGRMRVRLGLAMTLLVAGTLSGLAGPLLLGRIVNVVADGRGTDAITGPAVLLLVTTLAGSVLIAFGMALLSEVGEGTLARLRERVVAHALDLPLERVERAGSGDLYGRVSEDVRQVADVLKFAVPTIVASVLVIGLTLVGLAAIDWRYAIAGLTAVPIQAAAARWYLRRSPRVYADERAAAAARSERILNAFAGVSTVRALGLSSWQTGLVRDSSRRQVELGVNTVTLRTGLFARLNIAEFVGLSALLVAGYLLVGSGDSSIGAATAATFYFIRLFDPINGLLSVLDDAQQGWACLGRLVGVTLEPLEAVPAEPAEPEDTTLALRGIGHSYETGREVLREVALDLAAGERVALVGVSGAGKTTLARIAAGRLTPTRGAVRYGRAPVAALDPDRRRHSIGLVTQEVHVFAGPLRDDLRLARPDADDAAIEAALERVGAREWALALPDGLATEVGDGGVELTVVQAQQLALARLVLADPGLAVLDEATAEAGSAGARLLERAAEAALEGRTALIVAHRLSQAVAADRVVVLDQGEVVEVGSHEELKRAGGPYAALWEGWDGAR